MYAEVTSRNQQANRATSYIEGLYSFSETNFQDFSRTFPELRLIFQGSKIHVNS